MLDPQSLPLSKGACIDCGERDDCPMPMMLKGHRDLQRRYGSYYKTEHPDLWDAFSIDEPLIEDGTVDWCPMYSEST